ncbi:hypothetical protein KAU32_02760 [bacterium]|nr:hypothetical protein [bacterium]
MGGGSGSGYGSGGYRNKSDNNGSAGAGGSQGAGQSGDNDDKCARTQIFDVVIENNEQEVWEKCHIDDEVLIVLSEEGGVSQLSVLKKEDSFKIGLVPPSKGVILECIKKGWQYEGKITSIQGSANNPTIQVEVKGIH